MAKLEAVEGEWREGSGLKRGPAAHSCGERPLVEIVELAADRDAVGQSGYLHIGLVEKVGDVMRCALAIERSIQSEDHFLDGGIVRPLDQSVDRKIVRPDAVER